MKLEFKNENYSAQIIKIGKLLTLENCDNVLGVSIFGYHAIVSKKTKENDLMVLFTAETKLSKDYCHYNNLYRKPEMNKNGEVTGYLEEKGRVKALKFRGHNSSALLMPLSSLNYLNIDISKLKEGDIFDSINDITICEKYVIKAERQKKLENKVKGKNKIFDRVEPKLFPEHLDTVNYYRNQDKINDN